MQPSLMTVEDVMSKQVETIPSESTVEKALEKMARKEVGSLVVVSKVGPVGVLSERDLVSRLMAKGKTPEKTLVAEVMSGEIVKFDPDQSLKEAAKTMNSRRNRLLVFRGDSIVGIVTATDIVRAIHEMDAHFEIGGVIMKSVYTLKEETPLQQAVDVMSQLRVGSIIVTKDGEPDGIFTELDLVRKVLVPHIDLSHPLGEQASRPLITAEESVDGLDAAHVMTINNIKRLPLTRYGVIVGIVTARDLVEAYANS
jgi:CBS domain-containing protein